MQVSEDVKNAYIKSNNKILSISFPELGIVINDNTIEKESMRLNESIAKSDSIEFVGCISSKFSVKIRNLHQDIKGRIIRAEIVTTSTPNNHIKLFNGIVDNAVMQANKQIKEIVAYDELYTKGNIDIAAWYNGLQFPINLKTLRDSLFTYLGIIQVATALPNDNVSINKEYAPTSLKAINVIKAICQINGAFGIINRNGDFEYRIVAEINKYEGAYPGATLFPPFYPGAVNDVSAQPVTYYRSVKYEEYSVKPVDRLTIRQTDEEAGVSYGSGTNNYIIQGNMFTYNKTDEELLKIAQNIYPNIQGISYIPFTAVNNGFPWIECGKDIVEYVVYDFEESEKQGIDVYKDIQFYVFSRALRGIQGLKDEYSAEGEEYQRVFLTDLQVQIDTIKQNAETAVEKTINDYKDQGKLSDIDIVSVDVIPTEMKPRTLYLKRIRT